MGKIRVPGLGIVNIEGDTPNEQEQAAIVQALEENDPSLRDEVHRAVTEAAEMGPQPRQGPLGIMPAETRQGVREQVEGLSLLPQFGVEAGPSVLGAWAGGTLGAPGGPLGIMAGATVGGTIGELVAQETGLAPDSAFNRAAAAAGPLFGAGIGKGFQIGRRALGSTTTALPFVRTARARGQLAKAAAEFESVGTRIFAKQEGLMARPAADLYAAVRRAGGFIKPADVADTQAAITALKAELAPIMPFPEVSQAAAVLDNIAETLLTDPKGISVDTLVRARQLVGAAVSKAETAGGIKLGTAKQVFKALSDDLDKLAANPGLTKRAARLAKVASRRAKLEFSVKELEEGIARFTTETADGISLDASGMLNWVRDVTNPKHAGFNKNLTEALKDHLPGIKEHLRELAKIGKEGSPAGPASIVVRGMGARFGRAVVGGLMGYGAGGPAGAVIGGVGGASLPEMIVPILMHEPAASMLEAAARAGRGQIRMRVWTTLGEMATRAAGEGSEAPERTSP